jgi:hypothetical protein
MYLYYAPVYATIQDVVEPARRGTAMAVYFCAMYVMGASLGTGRDGPALRPAGRAGRGRAAPRRHRGLRAQGLHEAMYIVPDLSVVLAVVLLAAPRLRARPARADVLDGAGPVS